MAFGVTKDSVSLNDIKSRVTEIDILSFYLNIKELPCVINSPFREDNRPSFGIYLSNKSQRVYYKDYATNDSGGLFDLLGKLWKCDYRKVLENINKDINKIYFVSSPSYFSMIDKAVYALILDWRILDKSPLQLILPYHKFY